MTTTDAAPEQRPWVPDDSSLGARLALLRQAMGWGNVKEAAVACGVPVESWRTWERDNVTPRNLPEIAWRISQATGVDYGWLLDPRTRERLRPLEPRVVRRSRRASETNMSYPAGAGRWAVPAPRPATAGLVGAAASPARATRPLPATPPAQPVAPPRPTPAGPGERRTGRVRRPAA